ncbi:MAG: CRISPR-associated endonuclease Cas1 [Ignavibacteriae bacterium]|nr:MAG: CRISPR-associated endonuclease Cas1 [Ignavibacteriota bacterium]
MQININTKGTYIHVKDDMFEVKIPSDSGDVQKFHYSAKKVTCIVLAQGIALSTDAVKLAITNNIDIIFTEDDGFPLGRVWHSKLGSTTKIRKKQLEASMNNIGVKWIKDWIGAKLQNQVDFLNDLKKHRKEKADFIDEKIKNIINLKNSLMLLNASLSNEIADIIRGLEGTSGRIYFETLANLIADEYKFNGRSSRPAKDPFNAFLNYGYGVLYYKIEKVLIIAGIDPYLGFLHRDDYNQLSMVYDFIEPYRIYPERVVLKLFSAKRVNKSHTDEITNGYTLNKEGKVLLMENFTKYMDEETIRYKGRNQTRSNSIQFDAHNFANSLIK